MSSWLDTITDGDLKSGKEYHVGTGKGEFLGLRLQDCV